MTQNVFEHGQSEEDAAATLHAMHNARQVCSAVSNLDVIYSLDERVRCLLTGTSSEILSAEKA